MNDPVIEILKKVGAVITDSHIVGTSGRHMSTYINPDKLIPYTDKCSEIGKLFAQKFRKYNIDVVVGPAIGGIVIAQWTAYHLSQLKKKEILGVFTEKTPDKNQVFERDFDTLVKGKNVLVVEDITTTGGSVRKAVDAVKKAQGKVVGVSVIVNRDPKLVNDEAVGGPFHPLAILQADSYEETDCPLCQKNVPINTEVGHGKKYLEEKRKKG